ncbi:putative frequency clock protein [Podospora conica]|nr:putative frequency clock protein [Schizothecium conicum]
MDDHNQRKPDGSPPTDSLGHPRPRRTSPEQSVTLQNHRRARDAAERSHLAKTGAPDLTLARPISSEDSHDTARNNTKTWFDQSNLNDKTTFDNSMDVDPPFYQKETESSTGEPPPYPFEAGAQVPFLRPGVTQSSSADDYRSVIDDLTIENKRLKEELKRYKQFGPDMMRKEKLFELKVHGLPKRKKRELEATLRDFAASLEGSSESPPPHKKQARRGLLDYAGQSDSKHASSSSSRSRPVDSAYASMSTGPSSNAHNSSNVVGRPSVGIRTRTSTEQKVEDYLRETPGGLFPRHVVMTEKDKKKTVVRRLEQLFTGKMGRKALSQLQAAQPGDPKNASEPALPTLPMAPPPNTEAVREARIQPIDPSGRKPRSRDNVSMSNSNGDHTDSGGQPVEGGDGSTVAVRMGNITSPSTVQPPEQRPTRPKDLDPDRAQVPSENMDYIRHLGLVQPGFTVRPERSHENVSPDADGWVYLNLLCNLAQLHIFNVTPNFIRAAVTEKSTKFQLSADGRKIRWRGGTDGTKFSSDSSGDNSQGSGSGEDSEGSNESGQRKKAKTQQGSAAWGSDPSGRNTGSSDSFHYKPLFVRHSSSIETSLEGTGSQASDPLADGSNMGNSKWDYSGSGSSQRKKRRVDGAIVYYSGAPFCIDLSGDPGDVSPGGFRASAGQQQQSDDSEEADCRPGLAGHRTLSGSSLPVRPSSEAKAVASSTSDSESDSDETPDLVDDNISAATEDLEFPWCDDPQHFDLRPNNSTLEACGLGGVLPEDHFAIVVATKRPIISSSMGPPTLPPRPGPKDSIRTVLDQLRLARTASPNRLPAVVGSGQAIEIEEMDVKIWRLRPMPLPPAAMFFHSVSSDTESEFSEDESDDDDDLVPRHHAMLASTLSKRVNAPLPSSSDDEDEGSIEEVRQSVAKLVSRDDSMSSDVVRLLPPTIPSAGTGKRSELVHEGSSVATAGGAESGYSSSMEEDAA